MIEQQKLRKFFLHLPSLEMPKEKGTQTTTSSSAGSFLRAFLFAIILASFAQQVVFVIFQSRESSTTRPRLKTKQSRRDIKMQILQPRTSTVTQNEVIVGLSSLAGLYAKMEEKHAIDVVPVSYTHLTLPTKRIV